MRIKAFPFQRGYVTRVLGQFCAEASLESFRFEEENEYQI